MPGNKGANGNRAKKLVALSDGTYKIRMRDRENKGLIASRNIELGIVQNPERRKRCFLSFETFCREYFQATCPVWTPIRLRYVALLEKMIVEGGLYNICLPRGSAKTTLAKVAILWACLYGYKKNVIVCCASKDLAQSYIYDIARMASFNTLFEDFPELLPMKLNVEESMKVTYKWIDKILCERMKRDRLSFPHLDNIGIQGATVTAVGIRGNIRGNQKVSGEKIRRVDFVVCDDVQTSTQALNPESTETNYNYIHSDLIPLCIGEEYRTVLNCCTAIEVADLSARIEENRAWSTLRARSIESFPKHQELWERYAELIEDARTTQTPPIDAFAHHAENREAMYEGFVYNEMSYSPNEHPTSGAELMYLYTTQYVAFMSEYQNDPQMTHAMSNKVTRLQPSDLKFYDDSEGFGKGEFYGVDVHDDVLFALGITPERDEHGILTTPIKWAISDIRCWPDQPITRKSNMTRFKHDKFIELQDFLESLVQDNPKSIFFVDRGHGGAGVVPICEKFREQGFFLYSCKGAPIGPDAMPIADYKRTTDTKLKTQYTISYIKDESSKVTVDTNPIKSIISTNLHEGTMRLNSIIKNHKVFEQLCSEIPMLHEGRVYTKYLWRNVGNIDNHLWDCLVYALAAAAHHSNLALEHRPVNERKLEGKLW